MSSSYPSGPVSDSGATSDTTSSAGSSSSTSTLSVSSVPAPAAKASGVIVGIVLSSVLVLVGLLGTVVFVLRRRRRSQAQMVATPFPSESDGATAPSPPGSSWPREKSRRHYPDERQSVFTTSGRMLVIMHGDHARGGHWEDFDSQLLDASTFQAPESTVGILRSGRGSEIRVSSTSAAPPSGFVLSPRDDDSQSRVRWAGIRKK
ncbi:hypothetical protein C8Q78DRAFT_717869 [Trametes maxima]|nr:hypothetical protein C8Q78DRAFT_717869 [Trametes maxima]